MYNEDNALSFVSFLNRAVTPCHATRAIRDILDEQDYTSLDSSTTWSLVPGKGYYTVINDSALIAFRTGRNDAALQAFRIVASHVDSPGFRVKPNPEIVAEKNYLKLNTETYGSPILSSWLDRPLSLAGRIITRGTGGPFSVQSHLIDFRKPLLTIPSLAIHLNRDVNKGTELNRQTDMAPLLGLIDESFEPKDYLKGLLCEESTCGTILDADLFLYESAGAEILGHNREFISSGRLDNLASVFPSLMALTESREQDFTQVAVFFNNEEVGSATSQGADSPMLSTSLERIILAMGGNRENFLSALSRSFMVSADGAHGVHPNHPEKADPTNRPIPGQGPALKLSAGMNYATDALSGSVFREICEAAKVPLQVYVSRSDERGGSTVGPITSTHIGIPCADIGVPLLAMHSCRETACIADIESLATALRAFWETV